MFEKEAEEYLKTDGTKAERIMEMLNETFPLKITSTQAVFIIAMIKQVYQDGAEFGYNKANEWHDLRKDPNDLPKENELYLVFGYTNKREKFYELDVFDPKEGEFLGCGEYVYAWCEIPQFKGE